MNWAQHFTERCDNHMSFVTGGVDHLAIHASYALRLMRVLLMRYNVVYLVD